jgi:hypothetical protein
MINNLMNLYLQGANLLAGTEAQSLRTSSGNATRNSISSQPGSGMGIETILKVLNNL